MIQRIPVWPPAIRILHWTMVVATLVLMCTGWLLRSGLVASDSLYIVLVEQLHLPAGHVLGVVMAARLFLLVSRSGVDGFTAFRLDANTRRRASETWRFYTTFGKASLPNYYAHNPFWLPLYLIMFGLLLTALLTGLLLEFGQLRALFGISSDPVLQWHVAPFNWLSMLVVLHIAAVVSHDLKGLGADVSGMINGHRFVEVDSGSGADTIVPEVSVTLDSLGQWQPDGKPDSTEK